MSQRWSFLLGLGLFAGALHGQPPPPPPPCDFTFDPSSFSMSAAVGSSTFRDFTITPRSGTISFTFTPSNPQFTVDPTSRSSSTPFTLRVTFRPTAEGDNFEGVNIRGTQTGRSDCTNFLGGAAAGTPGFTLSTSSLDFGAVSVGQSATRNFTVTPSSALDFTITVNGAGFSATPPSFRADSARSITVTFTPTSAGAQAAQITVNAPGAGVSRTVNASGTGASAAPPLTITTDTLPNGFVTGSYSATVAASGGTPPYQFSAVGSLPPGLSLRSSTGEIAGVPATPGRFRFSIVVTDAAGATASRSYTVTISPSIVPIFSLSSSTIDFGDVPIGTRVTRTLVIMPTNTVDIAMNMLQATEFSLVGDSSFTIQSDRTVTLEFSPRSAGGKTWNIVVSAPNFGLSVSVELRGNGLERRETIIPHSAFGSGFLAQVFITNLAAANNEVTVSRFAQSGAALDSTVRTLPANGTIVIGGSEQQRSQPLTVQWARIDSQQAIASSILFDAVAGGNRTAVGALASPRLSRFTVPLWVGPGATGGVALANPMPAPVQVRIRLLDGSGAERVQDSLALGAMQQTSFVITEREPFQSLLCPQGVCGEFSGALEVTTADASQRITAMVVGSQQGKLFSLPVAAAPAAGNPIQGLLPASAYQSIIPHSAFGGGFLTRLLVTNLDTGNSNAITVYRFNQSGAPLEATPVQLAPGGTFTAADPESRRAQPLTVQWVAIASERPLTAAVVFDSAAGGERTAVGALSSPALTRFAAPLRVGASATGGVALLNLSGAQNTVSVTLIDQNGTARANDTVTLGAYQQTAFVATERPALRQVLCPAGACQEFVGSLVVSTAGASQPVAAMVVGSLAGQLYSLPVTAVE